MGVPERSEASEGIGVWGKKENRGETPHFVVREGFLGVEWGVYMFWGEKVS